MAQFLWIPWRLPKLNELLDQRGRVFRKKSGASKPSRAARPAGAMANGYSVLKKEWEGCIWTLARSRGFSVLPGCWHFTYLFVEPDAKFDPSNISSAAIKIIEDALQGNKQRQSLMEGDGWGTVQSITCQFTLGKSAVGTPGIATPGILLGIHVRPLGFGDMFTQAETMSHAERFHRRQNTYHATAVRKSASLGGGVPSGNKPMGETPAEPPAPRGARVRAQRAASNGGGTSGPDAGDR